MRDTTQYGTIRYNKITIRYNTKHPMASAILVTIRQTDMAEGGGHWELMLLSYPVHTFSIPPQHLLHFANSVHLWTPVHSPYSLSLSVRVHFVEGLRTIQLPSTTFACPLASPFSRSFSPACPARSASSWLPARERHLSVSPVICETSHTNNPIFLASTGYTGNSPSCGASHHEVSNLHIDPSFRFQ